MTSSCHPTCLAVWLAKEATSGTAIDRLHSAYCNRLVENGVPIWRSTLALEMLHPEVSGSMSVWTAAETIVRESARAGVMQSPSYQNSPVRIVDETNRPYRRRLTEDVSAMPLLQELKESGATDYAIFPLPFVDRSRTAAISYATQREDGFADQEIEALEQAAILFSPYAERFVLRRIAIDLLDTYVGKRSGQRVYEGAIERGQVETIRAAIWLSDLRGFTHFSDLHSIDLVLSALNQWMEIAVSAIEDNGGEVLKFMGDALLAIFPAIEGDATTPCRQALRAAERTCLETDRMNAERQAEGLPSIDFGIGLHLGNVAYGNIGGRARLDFTVIGAAVNHANRLQELSKHLTCRAIISSIFAEASGAPLVNLGQHPLRDVAEIHDVFTLPAERIG